MSNGLRINNNYVLVLVLFNMLLFTSCYEERADTSGLLERKSLIINKNDSIRIEMEFFENGFLKNFITKDHLNIKNGQQLEYYPNGVLKKKYNCKNGVIDGVFLTYNDSGQQVSCSMYVDGEKNGDMYEYSPSSILKSHILFEDGHAIYVGAYENGNKILSSPFPVFSNEKIRSDSVYEVKISFPFQYKGELEVFLRDTIDFKKEYLDKYALNLTISNFDKSWKSFELLLEYEPSIDDSLVWTEQVYKRTIEIK